MLYSRGINVLEDSSNWDWDETKEITVSTSPHADLFQKSVKLIPLLIYNPDAKV